MRASSICSAGATAIEQWWFQIMKYLLYYRDYPKGIGRGKIGLKSNQVMISITYDPYLGRIQGKVKAGQNNVISNYPCTVEVSCQCMQTPRESNIQRPLARRLLGGRDVNYMDICIAREATRPKSCKHACAWPPQKYP